VLTTLVDTIIEQGIPTENIYLMGFSQGACLVLEFVVRFSQRKLPSQKKSIRFGGIIGLSGGVIGPEGTLRNAAGNYVGTFAETPVFLGCSDRDPHIPKERFVETAELYRSLGASVDARLYPNMPHTIIDDELQTIQQMLSGQIFQRRDDEFS
jgi:predicted esterase